MNEGRAAEGSGVSAVQARQLLKVLAQVKKGDFSARLPLDGKGAIAKIAETLNDIVDLNERLVSELSKMRVAVGEEGRTARRAALSGAQGAWAESVESVNSLVHGLVQPTVEMGRV